MSINKITALAVESLLLKEYSDIYLVEPTKKDLMEFQDRGIELNQRNGVYHDYYLYFLAVTDKRHYKLTVIYRYLKHLRTTWVWGKREYSEAKFLELCGNRQRLDTPEFLERWKTRKTLFEVLKAEMRKPESAVWEIYEKMYHGGCPKCQSFLELRFSDLTGNLFSAVVDIQPVQGFGMSPLSG